VTDAHVWLGRLPPAAFLGGEASLDAAAIEGPLGRLADAMGATPDAAAEGILAVADSAMERALRVISVERGYDPRDFCLVAFGGAGGLHAAELAARIGVEEALIPPSPGLLSAFGILVAPVTRESSRTVFLRSDASWEEAMTRSLEELERSSIGALTGDGHDPDSLVVRRSVDARYAGQSFELEVPADGWVAAFHTAHEERYGYARPERAVEAVTLRVVAEAPPLEPETPRIPDRPPPPERHVPIRGSRGPGRARYVERVELGRGAVVEGPAIVSEYSATTWIPDGWVATVDEWGSLLLTGGPSPS
jgi:N-methylhydantoinase A